MALLANPHACRSGGLPFDVYIKGQITCSLSIKGATDMRFMMIVKASKESEAGGMPEEKILADMAKYNEELVKAGVMLDGAGLKPSSKGARIKYSGSKRTGRRWSFRRDEGARCRVLGHPGQIEGRGRRVGEAGAVRRRRSRAPAVLRARRLRSGPRRRAPQGSGQAAREAEVLTGFRRSFQILVSRFQFRGVLWCDR